MKIKEAAKIVNTYVAKRDSDARSQGLDSAAWDLRRAGCPVDAEAESIASDVASGIGSGGEHNSRKLIKTAKAVEKIK